MWRYRRSVWLAAVNINVWISQASGRCNIGIPNRITNTVLYYRCRMVLLAIRYLWIVNKKFRDLVYYKWLRVFSYRQPYKLWITVEPVLIFSVGNNAFISSNRNACRFRAEDTENYIWSKQAHPLHTTPQTSLIVVFIKYGNLDQKRVSRFKMCTLGDIDQSWENFESSEVKVSLLIILS